MNFLRKAQKDQCNNEKQDEASIAALTPKPAGPASTVTAGNRAKNGRVHHERSDSNSDFTVV